MLMATSAASTAGTRRGTSPSSARGAKAARRRRLRAGRLFEQGLSQAEVARRLHTSPQNVSRWHAKWRRGGGAALAERTRLRRPPRLSDSDWRRVDRALGRRGVAQDQGGAAARGAWLCFLDESGASLTPPVRRTWAPRGHTPVLRHRMRGRRRISMAGVCCYRPDGTDARLAFHLREGAYDTDQLIGVVGALERLLGGATVTLVWDNLPAHRSLAMAAWLADQQAWLEVEYLPSYAPDLNPAEGLWANLKDVELANRACMSLEELAAAAEQGVERLRGESELLLSFLGQAGLSL